MQGTNNGQNEKSFISITCGTAFKDRWLLGYVKFVDFHMIIVSGPSLVLRR